MPAMGTEDFWQRVAAGRGELPDACPAEQKGFHPCFVLLPLPLLFLAGWVATGPGGLSVVGLGFCQAALRRGSGLPAPGDRKCMVD